MTFQGDVICDWKSSIVFIFIFIKGEKYFCPISLGVHVWSRLDCDVLTIESQQSCGKRSWSSLVGPCFTSVSPQRDCGCRLHFPSGGCSKVDKRVWKIHQLQMIAPLKPCIFTGLSSKPQFDCWRVPSFFLCLFLEKIMRASQPQKRPEKKGCLQRFGPPRSSC